MIITRHAAEEIAALAIAQRAAKTGLTINASTLADKVMVALEDWRPQSFMDGGRTVVLDAFDRALNELEASARVQAASWRT